jgi:HK97 family phage major capsid protein
MTENQKAVPSPVEMMEKMSSSIDTLATSVKSFIDTQTEAKSTKEAFQQEKAEMQANFKTEIEGIKAEFSAELQEVKARKPVNVATPVKQDVKSLKAKAEEMCEGYILGVQKEHSKEDYKNTLCNYLEAAQEQKSTEGVAKQLLNDVKALVHNTNDFSLGGILLNAPLIIGMQERLFISSPLRQNATIISGRSDSIELILAEKTGQASFMSELDDFEDDKVVQFGTKQIRAMKVGDIAIFSDKIDKFYDTSNRLGVNFVSYVTDKLVRNIAMKLEQGYMEGADVQKGGKIEGFMPTLSNSFEKNSTYHFDGQKVGFIKSGSTATFTVDSFADLEAVFPQEFSQGSAYVMNPKTLAVVKKFKTTTGQPLFNQSYGIGLTNGLIQGEIMGRPVILDHYMSDVQNNLFPIGLVNIREYYTIYDAYGNTVVEKKESYGNKTKVNIRATKYSTGMIADPQAAVFLKIAQ